MEETLKFDQFQMLVKNVLAGAGSGKSVSNPERLHPLVLAYIGDAYYTLYVRTRLLNYEQNRVRVLHTFDAKIVSAAMQAFVVRTIEDELSELETDVVRRGRNAKSTPTKNASVSEYRYSTGFEALLGYLLLSEQHSRLEEIAGKVFAAAMRKLADDTP